MNKAISNALVIFMWAFAEACDPTAEQIEILQHEVQSIRDSVMSGALTIPQIRKALKDNYGMEVF